MCRPRILKALLPKRTASVNLLFSSLKNHLQVADPKIKECIHVSHDASLHTMGAFFAENPTPPPTIPLPAKTIPIWAAHTYMAYIWEYPLPRGNEVLLKSFKSIIDWAQNKRQLGRNSKWKINAIVADLHKQKLMYFGHLKRREGLEKIILEGKDRWEKRRRKTEEAVGKERHVRDVFDMSLTEVGRLALVRDCFSCAVKDVTSNGKSNYEQSE